MDCGYYLRLRIYACVHQFTVGPRQKMASAKFLEEALSTDVDESAVNAIVGSLETQLGTTTASGPGQTGQQNIVVQNHINSTIANGGKNSSLKHGVTNGGSESSSVVLNSDSVKSRSVEQQSVSSNVVSAIRCITTNLTSSGAYTIEVAPNVGLVQSNISNLNKSQDGVKVAFTTNQQTPTTNTTSRVLSTQSVTLPNGSVSSASSVHASSGNIQTIVATNTTNVNKISGSSAMDQSKPTGTAVVIKSAPNSSQGISPITTMTLAANANTLGVTTAAGVPGIVTLAKPISQVVSQPGSTIVGGTQQILPPNVQILNMNALRPGNPGQATAKAGTQRVVIGGPQVVGNRPVQQGITLQAFQGLAPGTQGHLLLKTENGQYQLLRVGPAPATATAASPAPPHTQTTTPFRTIPQNRCIYKVKNNATASAAVQSQVPVLATQNATSAAGSGTVAKGVVDQTKEKCRKFLANLLELSSREPKTVEKNVRCLIQELVNAKVEPEQFCDKLEKLLNASPQPCLIGFLKKSLPLLRQSMVNKELSIEGIQPPPASVLLTSSTIVTPTAQSIQVRNSAVQLTTTPQMRVISQPGTIRPGQTVQHRIITMASHAQVGNVGKTVSGAVRLGPSGNLRPTLTTVRAPSGPLTLRPNQLTPGKTQFTTRPTIATKPASPLTSASTTIPPHHHIIVNKQVAKKTSSSGVYTGDDDINDVALMGGVNLAEESQRILGSTEFVGTQIRSCKDELFLHSTPLSNKIAQIVAKHKLEEPGSDVAAILSHATQERLKSIVEKLAVIAEHRIDLNKFDMRYEMTQDVRGQLKSLEEIDKAERKRHEEHERELLMRAAKSRTKPEDPEQAKLKAKAREMQRAEMEELRQREANVTALLAIGPRKKPRLDEGTTTTADGTNLPSNRPPIQSRPRLKRVTMRDMIFLLEQERETRHSDLLFRSYFK